MFTNVYRLTTIYAIYRINRIFIIYRKYKICIYKIGSVKKLQCHDKLQGMKCIDYELYRPSVKSIYLNVNKMYNIIITLTIVIVFTKSESIAPLYRQYYMPVTITKILLKYDDN